MRPLGFILVLAALPMSVSSWALEVGAAGRFVCRQGNCNNGNGSVWDHTQAVMISGTWANAATIPGQSYVVTSPVAPGKSFQQVFGSDGLLESGEQPRTLGVMSGAMPYFSGRYDRLDHPFKRQRLPIISSGSYVTGYGIEYKGQFKFIPTKTGGFFLFFGERVDIEENERETDLFVSDEVMDGAPVRFVKADPGYLTLLQEKYQRDLDIAKAERQQEQEKAESRKRWEGVLSIVGKLALNAVAIGGLGDGLPGGLGGGTGGLAGLGGLGGLGGLSGMAGGIGATDGAGLGGQIALGLVSAMLNTPSNGASVEQLAQGVISSAASDRGMASTLTSALLGSVTGGVAGSPSTGPSGALLNTTTATSSNAAGGVMNAVGATVITRTGNLVSAALEGSDLGVAGAVLGAMTRQASTSLAGMAASADANGVIGGTQVPATPTVVGTRPATPSPPIAVDPGIAAGAVATMGNLIGGKDNPVRAPITTNPDEDPGTVLLKYTLGKGFFDPVAKRYIQSPAEMSCDNVTDKGIRLRDLPIEKRECVLPSATPPVMARPVTPASAPPVVSVPPPPAPPLSSPPVLPQPPAPPQKRASRSGQVEPRPLVPTARLASYVAIDPPDGMEFGAGTRYATNDGVYLPLVNSSDRSKHVGKYMGHSHWGVSPLRGSNAGFSPVEIQGEQSDSSYFTFTYFDSRSQIERYERSGLNVKLVAPGPWMDVNPAGLVFVPGQAGASDADSYVVNGDTIWRHCNCGRLNEAGQLANQFSRFHDVVLSSKDVGGAGFAAHLATASGGIGGVFVPLGDLQRIVRLQNGLKKIFDLGQFGPGVINTLVYYERRMWVGYGSKILVIEGDKISEVYTMNGVMATHLPTFCINGSVFYMANGESGTYIQLQGPGATPYLHDTPDLRTEDIQALSRLKSALGTGIYCADNGSQFVYAIGIDLVKQKQHLLQIQPQSWRGPAPK